MTLMLYTFALAEEAQTVGEQKISGPTMLSVPVGFRIDASAAFYGYTRSAAELSFAEDETLQTFEVSLTDSFLFGDDVMRVSALPSGEMTTQDGKVLPFVIVSVPQEEQISEEGSSQADVPAEGSNEDPEAPVFFDFDENGKMNLGIRILTPWAEMRSGEYTGKAIFTIAPYSEEGRSYEGTPAAPQQFEVDLSLGREAYTVSLYMGQGGGIVIDETTQEILRPKKEEPLVLALGNMESASLRIVPDPGYAVDQLLITPSNTEGVTLNGNTLLFENMSGNAEVVLTFKSTITIELDRHLIEMQPGEEATLRATIAPDFAATKPLNWTSDNVSVAAVSSAGIITIPESGDVCGVATIRCALTENAAVFDECAVVVHSAEVMRLPKSLSVISANAFEGSTAKEFDLSGNGKLTRIEAYAFKDSATLLIVLPENLEYIDSTAFDGCDDLTVLCPSAGFAEKFALEDQTRVLIKE